MWNYLFIDHNYVFYSNMWMRGNFLEMTETEYNCKLCWGKYHFLSALNIWIIISVLYMYNNICFTLLHLYKEITSRIWSILLESQKIWTQIELHTFYLAECFLAYSVWKKDKLFRQYFFCLYFKRYAGSKFRKFPIFDLNSHLQSIITLVHLKLETWI